MSVPFDTSDPIIGMVIDLSTSLLCFAISIGCVWLGRVILKEHAPMLETQRVSLYFVAGASFANAFTYWPDYLLIGGHRPTAFVLNAAFCVLVWVMVVRGNMINGGRMEREREAEISPG